MLGTLSNSIKIKCLHACIKHTLKTQHSKAPSSNIPKPGPIFVDNIHAKAYGRVYRLSN